jgi:hypothetical protein
MTERGIPFRPDRNATLRAERVAWVRAITGHALATAQHGDPARIVRSAWPDDGRAISRAAMSQTDTSGFPAYNPVTAYRSIAPDSAALALFDLGMKVDLSGVTSVRIPTVAGLPVLPIFIGEGQPGPAVQWTFGATVVGPAKKILLLSAVSGELENATPGNASTVIGRVLADRSNRGIDATALDAQPADDVRPAGLLHGVTPITAAAAGADAMAADLAALIGAIGDAGVDPSDAVIVCGPREATVIKTKVGPRFDNPILMTLGLPAKTVAAFAPSGIASGYQGQPVVETGREMVLHMEDTAPADISAAGTPPVVAVPTKSMFQSDLISIRVRAHAAWAAAPGAAQVISNVSW